MKKPSAEFLRELHNRHREIDEMTSGISYADALFIEPWWFGDYRFRIAFPAMEDVSRWLRIYGVHGNVLPVTQNNRPQYIGCPRVTWGKTCHVCEAISWGLSGGLITREQVSTWDDGIGAAKRFLLPVWWLGFSPGKEGKSKRMPDFGEFPQFKVFGVRSTIAKRIREIGSEDAGESDYELWDLIDPEDGYVLKMSKKTTTENYWSLDITKDTEEVPEEYMEQSSEIDFDQLIRDEVFGGHKDVEAYVESLVRTQINSIPEVVAEYLGTTDLRAHSLPPGKDEEEDDPDKDEDGDEDKRRERRGRRSRREREVGSKKNTRR